MNKEIKFCSDCHIAPASFRIKDTDEYLCKSCHDEIFEDDDK